MKAPGFWQKGSQSALAAQLLAPLGEVYAFLTSWRAARPPRYRSHLPVICIGNMTMGGSGKTPVVQAIARMLSDAGMRPAILLRGYGGATKTPLWVTLDTDPGLCGDEALLHARIAPTLISPDRVAGARLIEAEGGFTHIVMDDGLQNPALDKTLSLLVVDGENPVGNGLGFPAGPLREKFSAISRRVDAVVILGSMETDYAVDRKPVFPGRLQVVDMPEWSGRRVIAFAGIGRPQKFFDSVLETGAAIIATHVFADHHPYTTVELKTLLELADSQRARLVTTRKDWVRLPVDFRSHTDVLDVAVFWEDVMSFSNFIQGPDV